MGIKKLLIPLMVLLIASQAFATVTTTMTQPAGRVFYPIINNERSMNVVMTIVDDNAANAIHTVTIQYDPDNGDANTLIATDLNLSSSNCTFSVANVWTGVGASCTVNHIFPRTEKTLATQTYILDANTTGRSSTGLLTASGTGIDTFGINNQRVSANILAILGLSTLILAGILILMMAGFLGSPTDSNMMVFIAILGVGAVIGIILLSDVLLLLTP